MKKKDLPCAQDIEDTILGCMISNPETLNACIDTLEVVNFHFPPNKILFECIKKCCLPDRKVDIHILASALMASDLLASVGGIARLTDLSTRAVAQVYIDTYVDLLKEKTVLRDIIAVCDDARKNAIDDPKDPLTLLDDLQKRICSISTATDNTTGVLIGDVIKGKCQTPSIHYLDALKARMEAYKANPTTLPITGIPTGYEDLDRILNGLSPSTLTVLAASTSVGKTAFALNVACNVACKAGIPVGIFSLEMHKEQLLHRIVCLYSNVSSTNLVTGALTEDELQRVQRSIPTVTAAPLWIEDKTTPKINELRSRARRMVKCHGIKLLIVDYLTLIEPTASRASDNRQTDVASISRALKLLSRELNIPILCLAQLSRKVDDRQGHRPCLGDLRESGAIEHDSDAVLFLYRKDYYDQSNRPGEAEIIVAKNRCGRIGSVFLRYSKDTTKFESFNKTWAI